MHRDRFDYSHEAERRRPAAPGPARRRATLSQGGVYGTPDYDEDRADRARWERDRGYRYGAADNDRFGNRDEGRRLPRNETSRLIASDKVEGTPVYDRDGDRIGTIENFMVTKRSGRVEYAVLSFGGFMGLGDDFYPVDWEQLTYDDDLDGYVVDLDRSMVRRRPDIGRRR